MGCESVYIVVLNPTINKHVKQRGGKIEILDIQGHNLHISGYSMTERQDGKKMGLCFKALDQKGEQIKILRRWLEILYFDDHKSTGLALQLFPQA